MRLLLLFIGRSLLCDHRSPLAALVYALNRLQHRVSAVASKNAATVSDRLHGCRFAARLPHRVVTYIEWAFDVPTQDRLRDDRIRFL